MSTESEIADRVREWCGRAVDGDHFRRARFDSVHIDDLLIEGYREERAVADAFVAFDALVDAYRKRSRDLVAVLTVTLGYVDELVLDAPDVADLERVWDHFTPPEVYLMDRELWRTPHVVEEYVKPYPAGTFRDGYLGYYRCHRADADEYMRNVYVEHSGLLG